jgi:N-acetylneuraminate synthase
VTHKIRRHFGAGPRTLIVAHVGGFSMDEPIHDRTALYDNLERSLQDLIEEDTEIIIENMPPFPWLFGGQRYHNVFVSPSEIADFCKRTRRRICFDTSHAILACNHLRISMAEYVRAIKPYIAHMHVADGAGIDGEGLQIGEGEIDFAEIVTLLDGCDASFVPEVWQGHKFGGDGFWMSLDKLSEYSF